MRRRNPAQGLVAIGLAGGLLTCLALWPAPEGGVGALPVEQLVAPLPAAAAEPLPVPAASPQRWEAVATDRAPASDDRSDLKGWVVDSLTGEPITSFRVSWYCSAQGGTADDSTMTLERTDRGGRFTLRDLDPGHYRLRVASAREEFAATEVRVVVPCTQELAVGVDRGVQLTGRLLDGMARPVAGVEVALGDRRCRTDEQGRFHFAPLSPGYHELQAPDGTSATVMAPVRGLVERDLQLTFAGSLDVAVADVAGDPVDGITVRLLGHGGDHRAAATAADGVVRFLGWAPGHYDVRIEPRRGRAITRSLHLETSTDRNVQVALP